jgi:transcriptional regulator GlxA family with amidase domain
LAGATFGNARVVKDGNVTTAAGVASGLDFALHLVAEIAGAEMAQAIQLGIEYDARASVLDRTSRPCARAVESACRRSQ